MTATFENLDGLSGTITLGRGGTDKTMSYVDYGSVPNIQAVPKIIAPTQRVGSLLTADVTDLTDVTLITWSTGATGNTVLPDTELELISFTATYDGGKTITSPAVLVYDDKMMGHMNHTDDMMLALVPHEDVTHTANTDGLWTDPATWDVGAVPGPDAIVLIQDGTTVTYDKLALPPTLARLRIDGTLLWSQLTSTEMQVNDLTVTKNGTMRIGVSESERVPEFINHKIVISGGEIDMSYDPELFGKGIIGDGTFHWFDHHRTRASRSGVWPKANDTKVTMAAIPADWKVGNTICIPGTFAVVVGGVATHENEYRIIESISGNDVNFAVPLQYDHDMQTTVTSITSRDGDPDLQPAIFNITCNVEITSAVGKDGNAWERGHVMWQHDARPRIYGVLFNELGRTVKAANDLNPAGIINAGQGTMRVYNPATSLNHDVAVTPQSNSQTRYPHHMHHAGRGRDQSTDAYSNGCVVLGSTGWSVVHHACDARYEQMVILEFTGAGFVAEEGSELGTWYECYVAGTRSRAYSGGSLKSVEGNTGQSKMGDFGRRAHCYITRARMTSLFGCEAYGGSNGVAWWHRANEGQATIISPPLGPWRQSAQPNDLQLTNAAFETNMEYFNVPITHGRKLRIFGCRNGTQILKSDQRNFHDFNIKFEDWIMGAVHQGATTNYVGAYLFRGFDINGSERYGQLGQGSNNDWTGLQMGGNVSQIVCRDNTITNFRRGIEFEHTGWKSSIGIDSADFDQSNNRFGNFDNVFNDMDGANDVAYVGEGYNEADAVDKLFPLTSQDCEDVTKVGDGVLTGPDDFSVMHFSTPIRHDYSVILGNNNLGIAVNDYMPFNDPFDPANTLHWKTDSSHDGVSGTGNVSPVPKSWDALSLPISNAGYTSQLGDDWYGDTYGFHMVDFGSGSVPALRQAYYHSDENNGLPQKEFVYVRIIGTGATQADLIATRGWTHLTTYVQGSTKPTGATVTAFVANGSTETSINVVTGMTGNAGATFEIDTTNRPDVGRVEVSEDRTSLIYTPMPTFVDEVETFLVYIRDDQGCVGARYVTITVGTPT